MLDGNEVVRARCRKQVYRVDGCDVELCGGFLDSDSWLHALLRNGMAGRLEAMGVEKYVGLMR